MKTAFFVGQVLVVMLGAAVVRGDDGSARRYYYCVASDDDASHMFCLVGRKEVQEDLALTREQIEKLRRAWGVSKKDVPGLEEFVASIRKKLSDPMLSESDRRKLAEMSVSGLEIFFSAYHRRELSETLSAHQMQRLRELVIQMRGPSILVEDTALARAAHLSDEQLADMKETLKSDEATLATFRRRLARQQIVGLSGVETIQDRAKELSALFGSIRAIEKNRDYDLLVNLKAEQKAFWRSVSGKSLSIDWPLQTAQEPFGDTEEGEIKER